MTTENRILKAATELLNQAMRLWQAAQAFAEAGGDDEFEARLLHEEVAKARSWAEHYQDKVWPPGRRRGRRG